MIWIGIDPGKQNGVAILRSKLELRTLDFWSMIEFLANVRQQIAHGEQYSVVVEATYLNKPTWEGRKAGMNDQLIWDRVSRNVGANQTYARLIVEYLERYKIPYFAVRPAKNSYTKLDASTFCNIIGYGIKSNQHERDAAMLIWGRDGKDRKS